jgi:hypothetical protein
VVTGTAIEPITVYVCSCYAPGVVFVPSTTVSVFTGVTVTTPVTITNINYPTKVGVVTIATTIYENGTKLTTVIIRTATASNPAQPSGQASTTGTNPAQQTGQGNTIGTNPTQQAGQGQTTAVTVIEQTSTSAGYLPQVNTQFSGLGVQNTPITLFGGFSILGLFALLV